MRSKRLTNSQCLSWKTKHRPLGTSANGARDRMTKESCESWYAKASRCIPPWVVWNRLLKAFTLRRSTETWCRLPSKRFCQGLQTCTSKAEPLPRQVSSPKPPFSGTSELPPWPKLLQKTLSEVSKRVGWRGLATNSAQNTAIILPQNGVLLLIRGHLKNAEKRARIHGMGGIFLRQTLVSANPFTKPLIFLKRCFGAINFVKIANQSLHFTKQIP